MKTLKHWISLAAIVAVTVGTSAVSTAPATATSAQPCSTWRPYGFTTVTNTPAWADANYVTPTDVSNGQQVYTLVISQQQVQYMQTAINGGCLMDITFDMRGTTGAYGNGSSSYDGNYQVLVPGDTTDSGADSGTHPLSSCLPHGLTCQLNTQYHKLFPTVLQAGDVITVTGTATAEAIAGGVRTSDQAHADWRIRYPVLRIPIP